MMIGKKISLKQLGLDYRQNSNVAIPKHDLSWYHRQFNKYVLANSNSSLDMTTCTSLSEVETYIFISKVKICMSFTAATFKPLADSDIYVQNSDGHFKSNLQVKPIDNSGWLKIDDNLVQGNNLELTLYFYKDRLLDMVPSELELDIRDILKEDPVHNIKQWTAVPVCTDMMKDPNEFNSIFNAASIMCDIAEDILESGHLAYPSLTGSRLFHNFKLLGLQMDQYVIPATKLSGISKLADNTICEYSFVMSPYDNTQYVKTRKFPTLVLNLDNTPANKAYISYLQNVVNPFRNEYEDKELSVIQTELQNQVRLLNRQKNPVLKFFDWFHQEIMHPLYNIFTILMLFVLSVCIPIIGPFIALGLFFGGIGYVVYKLITAPKKFIDQCEDYMKRLKHSKTVLGKQEQALIEDALDRCNKMISYSAKLKSTIEQEETIHQTVVNKYSEIFNDDDKTNEQRQAELNELRNSYPYFYDITEVR